MQLSVVVPTLNGRDRLAACLDALAATAPTAEVIVVNGPSADGTTGMVRDRADVDVLVEVSARTLNVARNAGIEAASGDAVAFVRDDYVVDSSWASGVRNGLDRAPVATGPSRRTLRAGATSDHPESRRVCGRHVTYFDGGNVVFRAAVLDVLDGFDEYLETGGARDAAHRLAAFGHRVVWAPEMAVSHETDPDAERSSSAYGWKYRALTYRLAKNYGLRPTVLYRTASHAVDDATRAARGVGGGDVKPSAWVGAGKAVVGGIARGLVDGVVARRRDPEPRRNPGGVSTRTDRAVARYDLR